MVKPDGQGEMGMMSRVEILRKSSIRKVLRCEMGGFALRTGDDGKETMPDNRLKIETVI